MPLPLKRNYSYEFGTPDFVSEHESKVDDHHLTDDEISDNKRYLNRERYSDEEYKAKVPMWSTT